MEKQQKHGAGISDVQSLYLNRLRASKEKVCIGFNPDAAIGDAVILAFDLYTILIEAPVCMEDGSADELRQILLYKTQVTSIVPEGRYTPINMDKFNKGRKGASD